MTLVQESMAERNFPPPCPIRAAGGCHQSRVRFSSWALSATTTVLADIRTAPMAGVRRMPQAASTPATRGIAKMLQPAVHQRFCTIFRYVARESAMILGMSRGSERTSTMCPASMYSVKQA
jgi:hypothetical protein